jgi:hypothetical protein
MEDAEEIFVVWNSTHKKIILCTFNEELARKVSEHYSTGIECSSVPIYQDLDDYLDDQADIIAEEARKRLTPIEYESIKRTVEEDYSDTSEFDHEVRVLYD